MNSKSLVNLFCAVVFSLMSHTAFSQQLNLPPRATDAMTGSQFISYITPMSREQREQAVIEQVRIGNIPDFLRTLIPIEVTATIGSVQRRAIYYVTPDYLCIGSNPDYFLIPLSPIAAQQIADLAGCSLPTRKMVNDIYLASGLKLAPRPIAPSAQMTTVPVFAEHHALVWQQRSPQLQSHPLGTLVGGHKKDVVVTARLATQPGRVAIYGWHQLDGQPIQPLSLVHEETYADYSHGIRLVQQSLTVDGQPATVSGILADSALSVLLSDEGAFTTSRYPVPPPPQGFPYRDRFPSSGRQLTGWIDRFTTPQIQFFNPPAPGGDGSVLVVRDARGGIETTRLGALADSDYFVECYIYCHYRPELASDGFERVGIFLRDDGNGMFEGRSQGGIAGNNYALTWDSHNGNVRFLRTVGGTPVDLSIPVVRASSGWRKFRIEAIGANLRFLLDDEVLLSIQDATFSRGQFGIGYHDYFNTNANILGTYADQFLADILTDVPQESNWRLH